MARERAQAFANGLDPPKPKTCTGADRMDIGTTTAVRTEVVYRIIST
jgi:hypothetical protein